jgi:hypothetical protein
MDSHVSGEAGMGAQPQPQAEAVVEAVEEAVVEEGEQK